MLLSMASNGFFQVGGGSGAWGKKNIPEELVTSKFITIPVVYS